MDGSPAAAFKLPARGGGQVDLATFRGKPVLVNFWATWCPPCREEMPSLARLAESFDPPGQKTPFRVVWDEGARISRSWGVSRYPVTLLLDAEGRLRLRFFGPRNWMDPNVAILLQGYGARSKG